MIERQLEIPTGDGPMGTFVCRPERGGPHPVILLLMDAPGIREELRDMARRLGTVGYYVMLPNLYHRAGVDELGSHLGEGGEAIRARFMALMETLSAPLVMEDARALLAFADADPSASKSAVGAVGYCMSGQYALACAGAFPERVAAAASIYGVKLITDAPDSPHLAVLKSKAEIYVAYAEIDDYAPREMIEAFRAATRARGDLEIEFYPGVVHGFAFPLRPHYDKPAAERHWERLFALFGRRLGSGQG